MVTLRNPPPIFWKFDGVTGLLDLLWMAPVVWRIWIELATNHQWQGYAFDEAERWTFIALPPSCNVSAYSPRFLSKISEEHFGIFSTCPDDAINLDADDVLLIDLLSDLLFVSISSHLSDASWVTKPRKASITWHCFIRILARFFPAGKGSFNRWCVAAPGWAGQAISQQLGCHAGTDGPSGSHNMQKKAMKKEFGCL